MSDKCVCGHLNGQHWFESDAEPHPCHICECDDFNAVMFELDKPMITDKLSEEELKQMRIAYSLRYKQRLTALLPSPDALSYQMGYEDARQPERLKELEAELDDSEKWAKTMEVNDAHDAGYRDGKLNQIAIIRQALTAQESEKNG